MRAPVQCRDATDQPFLDLAVSGGADVLVSGDEDLLTLAGQTAFAIESPEELRRRIAELRAAIETGINSGIAEPGVFSRIREKHGLPKRKI